MQIINYVISVLALFVAAILFGIAARLSRADKIEGSKSAARSKTVKNAILGRSRTRDDWLPDARVKGGMIYNKKHRRLEISGRLSEDSLNRVFR
jgi:hypothetical protein